MAQQYYVPSAAETPEICMRSPGSGYSDPGGLVRDYVKRDGAGDFGRSNKWTLQYHYCPGPLPGWDIMTIVKEARVDSVVVAGPKAYALVTYRQIGTSDGDSFRED